MLSATQLDMTTFLDPLHDANADMFDPLHLWIVVAPCV
jgi:hypothetical protein